MVTTTGKIVIRIVFAVCVFLLFITDYSGVVRKLVGGNHTEEGLKRPPKPKNPGYGDPKSDIDIDADIEEKSIRNLGGPAVRSEMLQTIKNACLPKLICELNATPEKDSLTESERSLLSLLRSEAELKHQPVTTYFNLVIAALITYFRDTSISTTAELTSKYHFAAHMGQLIAGVEGNGCHNFYPTCPFPGLQVLQMMKKVRMR